MAKLDAAIGKHPADEKPTVAVVRAALAAEKRDPVPLSSTHHTLYGGFERILFGHRPIQRVAIAVIVIVSRRAAAELLAHEHVANAAAGQCGLERVAVELRRVARVRV